MSLPTNLRLSAEQAPIPAGLKQASSDPRALRILAKTIYRELRQGGLAEEDVMSLAGELLSLVTIEVKDRRKTLAEASDGASSPAPKAASPSPARTPSPQR